MDSGDSLGDTLTNTVEYCISHDIMRKFLLEHEQEVPDMYSLRYNEQAAREAALDDGLKVATKASGQRLPWPRVSPSVSLR